MKKMERKSYCKEEEVKQADLTKNNEFICSSRSRCEYMLSNRRKKKKKMLRSQQLRTQKDSVTVTTVGMRQIWQQIVVVNEELFVF